jgi:ABC-type multidrug transport system fused ATPase/permease subunit
MGKFDRAREMLVTTRGADEYEIARMMPLYEEVTEKDTRFKLYGKIIGEFPFLLVSGVAYPVSVVLASTAGGSAAQNLVEVMAAGVMGTYAGNAVGRAVDAGSKLPEQWQAFGRLTEQIRTRDATDDIDGARDIELDDSKPLISIERPVVSLAAKSTPVVDMHENEPIELRAGERIYIAGASGSGKSTLAKAIVRRLTLDDGCVRVSGVPVREATRSSLTQIMGFVPQAPEVFQGTLRQNIAFGLGDKSLSESEVQQWFRDLGFEKDGLDLDQQALNADHSPALSGGQVQRLALGRVLARRPKVLVLDEPTSALDRRSQAVVGSLIDRFQRKGGAVLEITHNVASVGTRWSRGNDDLVVVMDNGSVVEKGTHGDLMQNPDGAYRALHNADKHFSSAAKEFSPRIWAKGFMEMREGDHQRLTTGMSLEETLGYNAQWSDHVVDAFAAAGVTTDVSNAKFCRLIGREIDRMYSSSHTTPEECAVELAARVKNALIETGRVCDGQVALFEI